MRSGLPSLTSCSHSLVSYFEFICCLIDCFCFPDLDGSGTIEFDEYVRVMATYCMFTKDEILRFCFECFDVDKSGTIDEKEFVELCK